MCSDEKCSGLRGDLSWYGATMLFVHAILLILALALGSQDALAYALVVGGLGLVYGGIFVVFVFFVLRNGTPVQYRVRQANLTTSNQLI